MDDPSRSWLRALLALYLAHVLSASRTCRFAGEIGWRCPSNGECLPKHWICDKQVQCPLPDESDEIEGCQLFPETGCNSWYGEKHVQCPDGSCVQHRENCPKNKNDSVPRPPGGSPQGISNECPGSGGGGGNKNGKYEMWRCRSGLCILRNLTCDRVSHCDDGSDETLGCNLYRNEWNGHCKSWFGREYVLCNANVTSARGTCTLPQFVDNCRACEDKDQWRCDDGYCIEASRVHNGLKDCKDGSDEIYESIYWWNMLVITIVVASTGIGLSFIYRFVMSKKHFFTCGLCQSRKAAMVNVPKTNYERNLDSIDCHSVDPLDEKEMETNFPNELIDIFECSANWRTTRRSLSSRKEAKGQHLYALIHADPVLYRNLYRYLIFRFSTPSQLSRTMDELFRWEKDFHGQNSNEVVACWRLHLGSCQEIKHILKAIQPPGMFSSFYSWYMPKKNLLRAAFRDNVSKSELKWFEIAYMFWNTAWYLIKPFIGASIFYFDLIKDLIFAILILHTVRDLTKDTFDYAKYPFETGVVIGLFGVIVLTQLFFMLISVYYSNDVFEMCDHKHTKFNMNLFRFVSLVFSPLMPAFLLANHVYYLQLGYAQRRKLETLREGAKKEDKWKLYKSIGRIQYRCGIHRRIYSFFRVSAAVIQSFHMIVVIVIIVVVTSRPAHDLKLVDGVMEKISDFLQISQDKQTFIGSLDLSRDVVILFTISYSFLTVLSALVRYVHQCKNLNLVFGGKVVLTLYFTCHLISRLTMIIALLSTAETTEERKPVIPLFAAAALGAMISVFHFLIIFWFKTKYVENFARTSILERVIHVMVNTLVTIPFSWWDVGTPKNKPRTEGGMPQRSFSCHENSQPHFPVIKTRSEETVSAFPDIVGPFTLEMGDAREEIEKLWWEKPSRKIDFNDVKERFKKKPILTLVEDDTIVDLLVELEAKGFINKTLFNPQRTKREYFWLLLFQLVSSSAALLIEVINGGTYTKSGLYYSWDVRLSTFVVGIVFLMLYYKKYHVLRDINSSNHQCCNWPNLIPIFCCCRDQTPLTAIPVDEELIKFFEEPPPDFFFPDSSASSSTTNSPEKRPLSMEVIKETSFNGEEDKKKKKKSDISDNHDENKNINSKVKKVSKPTSL